MLKFLRKYQKWMLVVFCGGLMVAFLVPQAAQQFMPNPVKATMATTADGREIKREDIQRTASDLQRMRRLQFDPVALPALTLLPNTGSDADDAMMWILIQHAAEKSGLGASQAEAFNLAASALGVQTEEEMDKKAAELNIASSGGARYLMELARQYLVAEQYRQLVMGTEFTKPAGTSSDATGSPGLRRFSAAIDLRREIDRLTNQLEQQFNLPRSQAQAFAFQQVFSSADFLDAILGHERVTADQIRYFMQDQFTELDLTLVVLDAEDRKAAVTVDDAYMKDLFERFADDAPGQGQPYGLGYRVPNRVKLEALRIPIEQVRAKVATEITAEDVRTFYDERPFEYIDDTIPAEGEAPRPRRLTALQREEIRTTLTQMRAEERVVEIAEQARLRLNEDARGLKDDGSYKALPAGFVPTPMQEIVAWVAEEYGIDAEPIVIDEWVSSEQINSEQVFTATWLNQLPTSTVRMPNPQFGILEPRPVQDAVLSGRAGLFASLEPELSQQVNQAVSLAQYLSWAQPFVEPDSDVAQVGLQVGLPGQVVSDLTRSTYIFRITDADPAHRATDPTRVADQLREDAIKVKAYESLIEDKEAMVGQATNSSIESLMVDADAKQSLTALTRQMLGQNGQPTGVEGITSTRPIIERAFEVAEQLRDSAGFDAAAPADLVFAVELPGDYKLAVVRLDALRPLTRRDFERQVAEGGDTVLFAASRVAATDEPEPAWTMDALIRYTGLQWAEGFGPEDLDEDEDDADEEEGE